MTAFAETALFEMLNRLAGEKRMLLIAGLPGVGKSLMLQQAALLASAHGRPTHLLRWDVARLAFESAHAAEVYWQEYGITHAAIRLAVGHWLREAVSRWHNTSPERAILIGECPLVGNRFSELARHMDDALEPVLASDAVHFLVPAPSADVRVRIEAARAHELAHPRHESESNNAPPHVLRTLGHEVQLVAEVLGIAGNDGPTSYQPETYVKVYQSLLRHRHVTPLRIDTVLRLDESAQAVPDSCLDLLPSERQVAEALSSVAPLSHAELEARIDAWWQVDGFLAQ